MKLFNSMTNQKEQFTPLEGNEVRMYSCGPTVYNYAHIGNLRTYVFMDILRRVLSYNGYNLKGVMNITDVGHLISDADDGEDKMVKASKTQQKTPEEIASYYTNIFFNDLELLNVQRPEIVPKATDHIPEMIEFVENLLKNGFAYMTDDGIYFDIGAFKDYGKLSGIDLEEQLAGARVDVNTQKRHPADFALWKNAPKEHIMKWQSPWGLGYPGWHIECSAMGRKYLGDVFDIHSGGVDHIPIHHENEIAQSQALTGKQPANFWLHGEFMLVDGGKMSKKLGNTYTLSQLKEKGFDAMPFRFFCLNTHYRKKLNFTFEALESAKISYERLISSLVQHKNSDTQTSEDIINSFKNKFEEAIFDDLNVPLALGVLFTMLKQPKSKDIYELAITIDSVLGLKFNEAEEYLSNIVHVTDAETIPQNVIEVAQRRLEARRQKDFAMSDSLRNELNALGYSIKDSKEGYELIKNQNK